jgi:hypothetical protein
MMSLPPNVTATSVIGAGINDIGAVITAQDVVSGSADDRAAGCGKPCFAVGVNRVVAFAAIQDVEAEATAYLIVPEAAEDGVVAASRIGDVSAVFQIDQIRAVKCAHRIVAGAAIDQLGSMVAINAVVAAATPIFRHRRRRSEKAAASGRCPH